MNIDQTAMRYISMDTSRQALQMEIFLGLCMLGGEGIPADQHALLFWAEIFVWWHVSIWGFRNRVCLSVCTLRIGKKVLIEFWLVPKYWNHPSFINISPTVVIDTSMEWCSRVPTISRRPQNLISSKKRSKISFNLWWSDEITLALSIPVLK